MPSHAANVGVGVACAGVIGALLYRRRKKQAESNRFREELISSRGERLKLPPLPYIGGVLKGFANPYDEKNNPTGVILLAVAENKLCWDLLKNKATAALVDLEQWTSGYGPMQGQPRLRETLSNFLATHVFRGISPSPDELVVGTGVSAIILHLFYSICEAGDAVLIPAPYYSAFDSDLRGFGDLVPVPVPLEIGTWALTLAALDEAAATAEKLTGRPPRALLLTNPQNPLGLIMSREDLAGIVDWCDKRPGLHLVADEIYALSAFPTLEDSQDTRLARKRNFVSLAELLKGTLGPRRHVLWGLSKDFGASGFRVGVCWTQNKPLHAAMCSVSIFTCVSGPIQALLIAMLSDTAFVQSYVAENARRLQASCAMVIDMLESLCLPYVVPDGGMFMWCNFQALLSLLKVSGRPCLATIDVEDSWALERALYEDLLESENVVLTPGSSQHATEPGWFRICYAYVPPKVLSVALNKLESYAGELGLVVTAS